MPFPEVEVAGNWQWKNKYSDRLLKSNCKHTLIHVKVLNCKRDMRVSYYNKTSVLKVSEKNT